MLANAEHDVANTATVASAATLFRARQALNYPDAAMSTQRPGR
jgi:hypothetical protein